MSDLEGVVAAVCSSAYPATFLPASVAKARFELRLTTEVHRERIIIPKQQNRCVEKPATPFAGKTVSLSSVCRSAKNYVSILC